MMLRTETMMQFLVRKIQMPVLVVSAALQLAPIARGPCIHPALAASDFAFVVRWCAGAVALLGSYHAVSGATAAIAGVQNLNPPGPLTTHATGTVGQAFAYRIIVSNPGSSPQLAYYKAAPLPPGLTINTSVGGNGYITGKPAVAGVYTTKLTAGHVGVGVIVTSQITITIAAAAIPKIAGLQWSNNAWHLQIGGPALTNYVIWRSVDLANWAPIETNFSTSGSVQFTDPNPRSGLGFYRASLSR